MHTLEVFMAEDDLAKELLLGAAEVCLDSFPSNEGKSGVPGGVRSLITKIHNTQIQLLQN